VSVTTQSSGSQATVIGTEHVLASLSSAGVFQLIVNGSPLAAGDAVELRAKQKVLATDAAPVEVFLGAFADVLPSPVLVSDPVTNDLAVARAVEFTLKQTAGSPRTFDWKVVQVAA
jgi:hypothetical protein